MIRNIDNTDQFFTSALQADKPGLQPDEAIQERLRYMLSLKKIESKKFRRNWFRFDLSNIFSRSISYRAGIVSVAIVLGFFFFRIGMNSETVNSGQVIADSLFTDTVNINLSNAQDNTEVN